MQSFNWVDIDGIRYSWDGQGSITCTGQFGYQASIAGDRLDGMEIENEAGDVAGEVLGVGTDVADAVRSVPRNRPEGPQAGNRRGKPAAACHLPDFDGRIGETCR
mgnify:CR=1 FL=1